MIATIMPAMVGDLSGIELVGWSLAVYELGAITAGAAAGRLISYVPLRSEHDASPRLLYAAGALICAAAPSMPVFLAGRLVEGLGRRRPGVAGLRLGRAPVRPRDLAAAVRHHLGDLGRRRLLRSAVRGAGRRGLVLALGLRPVLDRRPRHGRGELRRPARTAPRRSTRSALDRRRRPFRCCRSLRWRSR